jgi:hypothetical protein
LKTDMKSLLEKMNLDIETLDKKVLSRGFEEEHSSFTMFSLIFLHFKEFKEHFVECCSYDVIFCFLLEKSRRRLFIRLLLFPSFIFTFHSSF